MRAVLLNGDRLNFDGKLSFEPIESVVKLIIYEATKPDEVIERSQGCEILISKELQLNGETIKCLPEEVRLICEAGTGIDNIDLKAAKKREIMVCNVPNYSTSHVAQLTINFILSMSSGLYPLLQNAENRDAAEWGEQHRQNICEVAGKELGVIGAGSIGKQVISIARALGMLVRVYSRTVRPWDDENIWQVGIDEVLAKSLFLTLHCPLQKDTRHLIRAETIRRIKRGAYIINTARGGLIDHDDLAVALRSGHIAGAALDVQEPEPLPEDSALRSMENVILTNHIGWKAIEARERLIKSVAKNIQQYKGK